MTIATRSHNERTRQYNADTTKLDRAQRKALLIEQYEAKDLRRLADHYRLEVMLILEEIGVGKLAISYEPEDAS